MPRAMVMAMALAALLVLAGCKSATKPADQPAPPPVGGAPEPGPVVGAPEPGPAKGTCASPPTAQLPQAVLAPPNGKVAVYGLCESLVGSDPFGVSFTVPQDVDEATVKSALQVEGAKFDRVTVVPGNAYVVIGAGKPGDVVTVRLAGPVGPNGSAVDLGFRLTRKATPTITAEIQSADGTWAPLAPGSTLPRTALTIRFTLKGSPNRQIIMDQIKAALAPRKDDATALAYQLEMDGSDRLLLTIPAPPPRLEIPIYNGPDPDGIEIRPFYLALYTGEKPRLVAFDPSTGTEKGLGDAPVDVIGSGASPDGKWIRLNVLRGDSTYAGEVWLVDTTTGSLRRTEVDSGGNYFWAGGHLIVPAWGTVQALDLGTWTITKNESAAEYFSALSPDGRLVAGFHQDQRREDRQTYMAPTTIVVHDWQAGKEETYTDVARSRVHHSESPPILSMRFSCDSTKLSWQEDVGKNRWRTLDRQTGQVTDEPEGKVPGCPTTPGPTDEGWSFEQQQPWGPITLTSPTGQRLDAGSGMMLGWQPDGKALIIRWPNGAYARQPGI